ncbi:MAG: hypothetical protein KC493_01650 [Bacteriovoracaceae bacterium]|nr:hypothetical protein [Bacteriovoracaceae bacterium]
MRVLFFLLISMNVYSAEMCPVGSRFLSYKGEINQPEILLCESTSPHEYSLLFSDGTKRGIPIQPLEGQQNLIEILEGHNWGQAKLNYVKRVHSTNIENENSYYIQRQNYRSITVLNRLNNNSSYIGSLLNDPCYSQLDAPENSSDSRPFRKYMCQVEVDEFQRQKLGLDKTGKLSIAQMESLFHDFDLIMKSKSIVTGSVATTQNFEPRDFAEYDLIVTKRTTNEQVILKGSCRDRRDAITLASQFSDSERSVSDDFVSPLDFKVNVAGMDVGFPLDVNIRPAENISDDGEDKYDVDLNLGVSTDVNLGRGLTMKVSPNIIVPFARDVGGFSDSLNVNNLTDNFAPTEVGVKFNIQF